VRLLTFGAEGSVQRIVRRSTQTAEEAIRNGDEERRRGHCCVRPARPSCPTGCQVASVLPVQPLVDARTVRFDPHTTAQALTERRLRGDGGVGVNQARASGALLHLDAAFTNRDKPIGAATEPEGPQPPVIATPRHSHSKSREPGRPRERITARRCCRRRTRHAEREASAMSRVAIESRKAARHAGRPCRWSRSLACMVCKNGC